MNPGACVRPVEELLLASKKVFAPPANLDGPRSLDLRWRVEVVEDFIEQLKALALWKCEDLRKESA